MPPTWLAGLSACAVFAWHARRYLPLFVDDSYISLRYAQRLIDGNGLTWSDGVPVEGYSNLLWVLGCALLGLVGIDLVIAARLLGVAGGVAAILALVHSYRGFAGFVGAMFIAACGPVAIWAVGGLEASLVAGIFAWALVSSWPLLEAPRLLSWRRLATPGLLFATLCWLRPDGVLLAVLASIALADQSHDRRLGVKNAARLALFPAVAVSAQLAFRWLYYADWVPNTARAKVGLTDSRVIEGLDCLQQAATSGWPLLLLGMAALWRPKSERRGKIYVLVAIFLGWTAYVLFINSEHFGYRSLIPTVVVLAFLAAETVTRLRWRTALVVGAALPLFAWLQQRDTNIASAAPSVAQWSQRGEAIGRMLKRSFAEQRPLIAVDAAGAIPYYSELPALDMLGLNDRAIARNRPDSFGHGLVGHELGDGNYVLGREPDLIISGVAGRPRLSYRGGAQLNKDPRFAQHYRRVRWFADSPIRTAFYVFVRIDGRLGVRRDGRNVLLPGHLFSAPHGALGRMDDGHIATEISPGNVASVAVFLVAGSYDVSCDTRGPAVAETRVHVPTDALVTLDVRAGPSGAVQLKGCRLERTPRG